MAVFTLGSHRQNFLFIYFFFFFTFSKRTRHREVRNQGSQWLTFTYESPNRHFQASSSILVCHRQSSTNFEDVGRHADNNKFRGWKALAFAAYVTVIIGILIVSALVSFDGWDCRNVTKIYILFAWLLGAFLDSALSYLLQMTLEWMLSQRFRGKIDCFGAASQKTCLLLLPLWGLGFPINASAISGGDEPDWLYHQCLKLLIRFATVSVQCIPVLSLHA